MNVPIMGVGRSGAGKSTIGNLFLNGGRTSAPPTSHDDAFETSAGAESCTKGVDIRSCGERSYLDVPGIPDTNACLTKGHYDMIVNAVKQEPVSALLFVFKYEKIDEHAFQMAEILFRELQKANCLRLLVINDHNSYKFNAPPSEEEYAKLTEKIQQSTNIQFDGTWTATSDSLQKTVDEIHDYIQGLGVDPKASPHLKDFDELRRHLDTLQTDADYKAYLELEAKLKAVFKKGFSSAMKAAHSSCGYAVKVSSFVGAGGAVILGGGASAATGGMIPGASTGIKAGKAIIKAGNEAGNNILESSKENHEMRVNHCEVKTWRAKANTQAAIEELKKAKQHFEELCDILDESKTSY